MMKIDMNNVFIGTIERCTKYEMHTTFALGDAEAGYIIKESVPYKCSAKLLKVTNGGYVDLDLLNSFLDEIEVKNKISKDGGFYRSSLIMGTSPYGMDCLFVNESTLKQYIPLQEIKRPTVKKLKKSMLMDVRIPGGIEW